MKKVFLLTILFMNTHLFGALPTGTTLTSIPGGSPSFLDPSEWLSVPSSHQSGYVLRFRAKYWDGFAGDLNFFMKYKNPEGTEGTTNFLIRNHNDLVSIYHKGISIQSLTFQPMEAVLPTEDRWHEIRVYNNIVSFWFSENEDGPWTRIYSYTLPYEQLNHTGYGFSSYEAPHRFLQMAEFQFNPSPNTGSTLTYVSRRTVATDGPPEWFSLPSELYSFTLRFKARLGDEVGDLCVYFKIKTSPTALPKHTFLLNRGTGTPRYTWYPDTVFPVYTNGYLADDSINDEQWHEIRVVSNNISFHKSPSASGPWTEYISDSIEPVSSYLEFGFGSYVDESQGLYLGNFELIPGLTQPPGLEWSNNGRENLFSLDTAYDIGNNTAPLKTTTTSPSTQLLSNLVFNPIYTSIGDWQFTDSTNGHTWVYEDATGVWQNSTTGAQWHYSNPNVREWQCSTSNTRWKYDENTKTWVQITEESSS